jgi:hypothetical protein
MLMHRDSSLTFVDENYYDGEEGAPPPKYGPQRHLNDNYWKQLPLLSAT